MKNLQTRRVTAAVWSETSRGSVFTLLGYSFLFGVVIAAVLAMHGLTVP